MNPSWAATFLQEADDLLASIEEGALRMSEGDFSSDLINELFRAFHTLKGSGSMFGLKKVPAFTHHVESLLDLARSGLVPSSRELAGLLLTSKDHIKLLLDVDQGGNSEPAGSSEKIIEALNRLSPNASPAAPSGVLATANAMRPENSTPADKMRRWEIRFKPNQQLMMNGGNPLLLLRDLAKLGKCDTTAFIDDVPPLDEIDPMLCYLSWTIMLDSACDRDAILDVFMFVQDDSDLRIEDRTAPETQIVVAAAAENVPAPTTAGPQLVPQKAIAESAASATTPAAAPAAKTAKDSSVKVPSSRLDRLISLVGELVMNQSRLAVVSSKLAAPELVYPVEEIERLVAELRDDVLSIRMLPIGSIFGRFRRVVHDLSTELGKEADLVTEGEDTELDKSILDQIGEPLVHLLRNSIDHGIELPDARVAAGKPRRGTIWLVAEHMGSDVVISIRDDGRGLNRTAIRTKAIERKLISPEAVLTDKEICNLTLLPGFSTAAQITSVSGRGVGMDAVKRQVDALRGTLTITSEEGKGTRTALSLPLTLAIIEGLVVEVGGDQFILPMSAVMENVELQSSERTRNNGRNVLAIRGVRISYIGLRELFGITTEAPAIEKVVIVKHEDQRVGFVVDRVLGTHQTVLQSLGRYFRTVEMVSGATIMGDGRVALVLDIGALVRFASLHAPAAQQPSAMPVPVVPIGSALASLQLQAS